jgi:hypothetical protein
LVTDNGVDTALYAQCGALGNTPGKERFANADFLLQPANANGDTSNLTKKIQLTTPAEAAGKNIASITFLLYEGAYYEYQAGTTTNENGVQEPVLAIPNFFDDIFNLIKSKPLLNNQKEDGFLKMTTLQLGLVNQYYDKKQQGLSAVQGLTVYDSIKTNDSNAPSVERVTYCSIPADVQTNVVSFAGNTTANVTGVVSAVNRTTSDKTYQLPPPYYYELKPFSDGLQNINGIVLKTIDGSIPNMIILGITKTENESLKTLITNTTRNPRLFLLDLFDDGADFISPENIPFQKYKVGIVAEDLSGTLKLFLPTKDIFVFSLDRKYHFSTAFSEFVKEYPIATSRTGEFTDIINY